MKESFLRQKLDERKQQHSFRSLKLTSGLVDFCSNDYLGLARSSISASLHGVLHGSTGSRLLSGNYAEAEELEKNIALFHRAEAALLFNSGYDANIGLIASVARKGDHILYDQLSHASIRDGIRLSFANSFSFNHNDTASLENKLRQINEGGEIFVVTESVFSMDGDKAPLTEISAICSRYNAHLIVDEAHGFGVIGQSGEGLVQQLGLEGHCLARLYTYGKAGGAHGAAITGSAVLRDYLVNFARSFIYTTALPPSALFAIRRAYDLLPEMKEERSHLNALIRQFQQARLRFEKLPSQTPIQGVLVNGNDAARELAETTKANGIDIRPILYPTVPKGAERLRIILHSFNTAAELETLIACLS